MPLRIPWRNALAKFWPGNADRRGAIAITVAIVMVLLLGIVALATDTSQAISARTRLSLAADAAALTALRAAAAAYAIDPETNLNQAEAAGEQRFRAQASGISKVSLPVVSVHVTRDKLLFRAVVTYTATYTTQIAGALQGINAAYGDIATLPLGGTASAQESAGAYVDIYVLMDVSNSMAIGATDDARDSLKQLTSDHPLRHWGNNWWPNCAIACHMKQPLGKDWTQDYGDYYEMAKHFNVTLRIDVLKTAVSYIASTLAAALHAEKFRFGLYTFDTDVLEKYALGPPSSATSSINSTEVTPINDDGVYNQTNVARSIATFGGYVGQAGDGSSPQASRKYVFILTDGIEDFTDGGGNRATVPFDPKVCQDLKDRGVIVLVLQTTNDDPNNQFGENALLAEVRPLLEQCASSPALFTAASTPSNINAAIRTMVNFAVSSPAQFTQ